MTTPNAIQPLLKDLRMELRSLYKESFAGAILYGSYARGEENTDSDIDILVILSGMEVSPFTEIDRMGEVVGRLNAKYNQLIVPFTVQKEQFESCNFPIYKSIKKEGIWI